MNSYKGMTYLLLFSMFGVSQAQAYSCKEIRDNLISLEHQYQVAKLEECDSEKEQKFCQSVSDPDSQKTVYEAQLDYNKALAKVNILEGLIAISSAVENDHAAMKTVTVSDLSNAKTVVNNFLMSFDRADLLGRSLEANAKGEYFWEGYNGSSEDYTRIFVDNKCRDDKSFKSFCDELKKRIDDSHYYEGDLYDVFHGFAVADKRINPPSKQELDKKYEDYRKYLMFTTKDQAEPVPLSHLQEGNENNPSEITKVHDLKKLIKNYESNKDPKVGAKIVELSNQLKDIKMGYNSITLSDVKIQNFITDNFEKGLTAISSAAGVLTGEKNIKNNFQTSLKSLGIELEGKEDYLVKTFNEGTQKRIDGCDPVKDIEQMKTCLKNACGSEFPDKCSHKNVIGVEAAYNDFKGYAEAEKLKKAHESMLLCLDNEHIQTKNDGLYKDKTTVEKKQICMDNTKKQISDLIDNDSLQDAQKELEKAKRTLDSINQGDNIKKILAEKFVTIKMLKSNRCVGQKDYVNAGHFDSFCNVQLMNIHSQTAIKLEDDVNNVLMKYDSEVYEDFFADRGRFAKGKDGKSYYDKMIEDCNANKDASSVCKYFFAEEKKRKEKERQKQEIERRKQEAIEAARAEWEEDDVAYEEGRSAFSYAMGGLATGVIKNAPGLMGYFQQRQAWNRQTQMWDNQINMHNYYYGAGANHHTYNLQVNYDDWYAGHNVFNPTNAKYFSATNSLYYPNFAPNSFTSNNGALYLPASSVSTGSTTSFGF